MQQDDFDRKLLPQHRRNRIFLLMCLVDIPGSVSTLGKDCWILIAGNIHISRGAEGNSFPENNDSSLGGSNGMGISDSR